MAWLGGLGWKTLAKRVFGRVKDDRITDQSAKLSFYFLLSIFPLIYFVTALIGLVLSRSETAVAQLQAALASVAPAAAAALIDTTAKEIVQGSGGLALSLSLLATIWTSSRGMAAIIEGLNVAYEVRQYRSWWKRNLLAVGLMLGFCTFLVVALALLIYGGQVARWGGEQLGMAPAATTAWAVAQNLLMLGIVLLAFNVLYAVAPNVRNRRWHWLMPGTLVGVGLWLAASYGFKLYLAFFDRYAATYGSIGAVIVLLLWFYLSGISILVGGEVNSEVEKAARQGDAPLPKEG
jgi:membrane protein